MSKGTIHDFISKIDWEGSVEDALQYGLKSGDYDLPKHIAEMWDELSEKYKEFFGMVEDFWIELDKVTSEESE